MLKIRALIVTYSKAKVFTKEEVNNSKLKYFVALEVHEKLFREKEFFEKKFEKLKKLITELNRGVKN